MFDISRHGPWALIAGASEGVGAALAEQLAERGADLLLVARKRDVLDELADRLRTRFGVQVETVAQDLLAPDAMDAIEQAACDKEVGLLVVNAGANTYRSTIAESDPARAQAVIDLNITVPIELIRRFAPAMKSRGRGAIVLTGSLSQFAGNAGIGFYSASKAFLHNLSEALWVELRPHGVDVLEACLGLTRTPAMERLGWDFDGAGVQSSDPHDVARETLDHIGEGPLHIADGNDERARGLLAFPREAVLEATNAAFIAAATEREQARA